MLELLQLIKKEYQITTTTIKPFHSVWKLTTPGQVYILKKYKTIPHNLAKMAPIINEYHNRGFKALVPILPTRSGDFFIESADNFYSLSPWCAGEKPSFRNQSHLKLIAQCFGKLHAISKTIALSRTICLPPSPINQQCISEFQTKQNFLESLLPDLPQKSDLNRIDRAVIDRSEYYLRQGRIALLGMSDLKDFWPLINNQMGFCHNDPAPGNIIINNNQLYLIDFEFSNYDLYIKEFTLLAQRALLATDWIDNTMEILINSYNHERSLLTAELKMLPYLICFPRRFWRFCHQRYQERLTWTEKRYQSRLWEIIEEEPRRNLFLQTWWPELGI